MRLDDMQRSIRCPSYKAKHNIEAQKESVVSVIIGQSLQCKLDQLLAEGDLRRKENITCHMEGVRNLSFEGRKTIRVTVDNGSKIDFNWLRILLQSIRKTPE